MVEYSHGFYSPNDISKRMICGSICTCWLDVIISKVSSSHCSELLGRERERIYLEINTVSRL